MTSTTNLESDFNRVMHENEMADGILFVVQLFYLFINLFSFWIVEVEIYEDVLFLEDEDAVSNESASTQTSSTTKVTKAEQKDIQFMSILSRVGGALLSKSLAPAMKFKKKKAAGEMAELLLLETGEQMTVDQIVKKASFSLF